VRCADGRAGGKIAAMKKGMLTQLRVGLGILVLGGVCLGGEYLLVKWYPTHEAHVREEALQLLPYQNDELGIDMKVAAGLYGSIESFAGGVKIMRPLFWSFGPYLRITSENNLDHTTEFSPEQLAKWQTLDTYQSIPRYSFQHLRLNDRDAVITWQFKDRAMLLTAKILSPNRIIVAECSPGSAEEKLYMEACEDSVHTIKVAGPPSPAPSEAGEPLELRPQSPH
jgi:hypothetical protein